jgi:hypothetical protein
MWGCGRRVVNNVGVSTVVQKMKTRVIMIEWNTRLGGEKTYNESWRAPS